MKKLISLMLVLALCLLGCAVAENEDVTGDWYLNIVETEGMQLDPVLMGFDVTITLNADGSAVMAGFEESSTGCNWSMVDGAVQISDPSGDSLVAVLDGGNLVINDEESQLDMIFGREKQGPQGYVPASAETNPSIEDFQGAWNAALIDMMGMQVSMENIGMKLMVVFEGSSAIVTSNESGEEVTYTAPVELKDGMLIIGAVEDQLPIELQMLQDGKMVYSEDSEGMTISMYFEKIA